MYVEKKKISGKEYYYLKASVRQGKKVITKTVAYLGKGTMSNEELNKKIKEKSVILKEGLSKESNEERDSESGFIVNIKTADEEISGILLQSFDPDIVLVKLKSGYNIGIEKSKIKEIKKISKIPETEFPSAEIKQDEKEKPQISFIITGGTISSRLDYATGAVKWLMKPEQLLFLAPKIFDVAKINSIERPFMVASENMSSKHWREIAKKAVELLNKKENSGVIITHGTDTLHYTAAALSFMLRNLNKPVILTYSQRSTDRGSTDTVLNLTCSAYAALSNIAEVMLVGHATTNDNCCFALHGTKVRKMHTSRRDTFRPINDLPIAKIYEDGKIEEISNFNKRHEGNVELDDKFDDKIALIKFFPGATPDILEHFIKKDYHGIVIEATGLGHVATDESELSWLPMIKKAIENNIAICFAAQTIYGRLDPYIYTPGRKLLEAGVIFLEDMLSETAYVKLGWTLGHTRKLQEVKDMMLKDYAHELNSRISEKTFLY